MASMSRLKMFEKIQIDGNDELDYLDSSLDDMSLSSIDTFVISDPYIERPDLVSYRFYRNHNYGWLIAWHNDMLDPIGDMSFGKRINIPSIEEYYRYINRNRRRR
jgi:hypothetical protein